VSEEIAAVAFAPSGGAVAWRNTRRSASAVDRASLARK